MKKTICAAVLFLMLAGCAAAPAGYTEEDLQNAYDRGYNDGMEAASGRSGIFDDGESTITVYITKGGDKYHSAGCQYLRNSCIPVDLEVAKEYFTACSKCNPPK